MVYGVENGIDIINKSEVAGETAGRRASKPVDTSSCKDAIIYDAKDSNNTGNAAVIDSFNEYMKDMAERAKEEGIDEESLQEEAKENQRDIARNLSDEEVARLRMLGIDVENTKLSDLMGMVNSLRLREHQDTKKEILADAMGVKTDMNIQDILQENKDADSVGETGQSFEIKEADVLYLIKNNLDFTGENVYKAHYSGNVSKTADSASYDEVRDQIEKILFQAGYSPDEENLSKARLLFENDIPVTTDNIRKIIDYSGYVGEDISNITLQTDSDVMDKAQKLYDKVDSVEPQLVYEMARQGMEISIAAAYVYSRQHRNNTFTSDNGVRDESALTAKRQMEEIRLSMTFEASVRLVKKDINIDTRELSKVVAELRNMEKSFIEGQLATNDIEVNEENINLYRDMQEMVDTVKTAPSYILGNISDVGEFTVTSLYESAVFVGGQISDTEHYDTIRFDAVYRSYEALGTKPRTDMGDSMSRAFSNIGDMLKEMDYPVSGEAERAVKILAYNSIEITAENIDRMIGYDRQINELCESFYPDAVLSMIKDGINPMDIPVDELNQILREKKYSKGVTDAENFASYLRDMEKQGLVSEEERKSYIGIYRMVNKLAKSGNREAGYLFANQSRLTVRNLITAMRSMKNAGIDVRIDQNTGLSEEVNFDAIRIDEQIESAFKNADDRVYRFMEQYDIQETMINTYAVNKIINEPAGIFQAASDVYSKLYGKDDGEKAYSDIIDMADSLTDSDDMQEKYSEINDRLVEAMYDAGELGTIKSVDIAAVKMVAAGFKVLGSMAKKHSYQLPIETESGIRVLNLTIASEEKKSPGIHINMQTDKFGYIEGEFTLSEGLLSGSITAAQMEENNVLMGYGETVATNLKERGVQIRDFAMGTKIKSGRSDADGSTTTKELYRTSLAIVKSIGVILK